MEDAAPDAATTSVEATGTVVTDRSGSSSNSTAPGGVTIRRPNSLNSAIGGASTGSPVTSPTSGSTTGAITASLRPVSAPFLPHQTTTTEASNDRLSSTATKNLEENNNDDKGTVVHWSSISSYGHIDVSSLNAPQIMTKKTTIDQEAGASPRKESFRDDGDQRDDLLALCT